MSGTLDSINHYKLLIETTGNLYTTGHIENGVIHLTIAQWDVESPLPFAPSGKPNFTARELIIKPFCSPR
jgi:hypothetical protein